MNSKSDKAPAFTPGQQKAIDLRDRNILVSASAGAGKTAVLTERIVSILLDGESDIDIDNMIVVTFTRAAAAEMRSRIGKKLTERLIMDPGNRHIQKQLALLPHAQITTIDSFCLYVVRNYFYTLSIDPAFRIGDTQEIQLIKNDVMDELLECRYAKRTESFVEMVEMLVPGKNDEVIGELVNTLFEYSRSHPWPAEWLNECRASFDIKGIEDLDNSEWILNSGVTEHIYNIINGAAMKLEEACRLCEGHAEFAKYLDFIQEEYVNVKNVEAGLSYSQYGKVLDKCTFGRFPSKKISEELIETKNRIKELRDAAKADLCDLKESYYFADTESMIDDINASSVAMNELIDITLEFADRFAERKAEENIVDFSDVEHFALEILLKKDAVTGNIMPTQAADEMMKQYKYILIDEYQDSNEVQETILTSFCRERIGNPNMFMVGDVKQSIYQFRLAKPDIFESKRMTYTDDDSANQRVLLKQNFRSTHNILSTINYIFSLIMTKKIGNVDYDETQRFDIPEPAVADTDETVDVIYVTNEIEDDSAEINEFSKLEMEAMAIAEKIKELTDINNGMQLKDSETGIMRTASYGDIVILLRSMSGWAEEFVETLTLKGIPAYAEERKGYFAAREIQIVLSMLRIVDNPHQDVPLAAVLRSQYGCFNDEELVLIRNESRNTDLYSALLQVCNSGSEESFVVKCRCFNKKLSELRELAPYLKVHELIEKILIMDDFIWNMEVMPSGKRRRGNLRMLVDKALEFENADNASLFRFLEYIDKMQNSAIDFGEAEAGSDMTGNGAVRIMSIHKSKGLEFPIVFVSGMGKDINLMDARKRILVHSELGLGTEYFNYKNRIKRKTLLKNVLTDKIIRDAFGEEQRVLYVALTRAKLKLIMTGYVNNPHKTIAGYAKESTSYSGMMKGKSCYFKWLIPCFMKHPGWNEDSNVTQTDEFPSMTFKCVTLGDLIIDSGADEIVHASKKQQLKDLVKKDVLDETVKSIIENQKSYHYPYERETGFAIKVSVSDIKHKAAILQEDEPVIAEWVQTERPEYVPRFMKSESMEATGGAARGTLYHTLMQYIEIENVNTVEDVHRQIEILVKKGIMPQDVIDKHIISESKIVDFCDSEVARRMIASKERNGLFKEQPFVMGISADSVYKDVISDETVLVQGIIDVFFEEEDGMVLLDYKTDRLNVGEEKRLIDRYSAQMDCYRQAIEKNSAKPVKEVILYSFSLGKEIHL